MFGQTTKSYRWLVCVLCTLFFACSHFYGQQDSGGILISVTDSSGAVVKNAEVTATNNGTNAKLQGMTNGAGSWLASPLPVGDYTVTVEQSGFQKAVASHVTVEVQQASRVPVVLVPGGSYGSQ